MDTHVETPRKLNNTALGELILDQYTDALGRGRIYHFLELALAHPGEDASELLGRENSEVLFLTNYVGLFCQMGEQCKRGIESAKSFFQDFRKLKYEEVEASYIELFSANFPHLPCPPYGSLFLSFEGLMQLEEMLAIKKFYHKYGIDIDESFDDLPDHLCVELEFLQILCFREDEAEKMGDCELVASVRTVQAEFLDRFLLPFAARISEIANETMPENLYSKLLDVTNCTLLQHRHLLSKEPQVDCGQENRHEKNC